MREILQALGVASAAEHVTPICTKCLGMYPVTVKATDVILAVLADLPFLVGHLVAITTHFRGDGQGHFSVFFRVPLAHDAVAGFTGDTGV